MDLDFLAKASSLSTIATVVFTVLAALAGVAAWYFGVKVGDAKDAELERFKLQAAASIAASDAKSELAREGTATALRDAALASKDSEEAKERAEGTAFALEKQRERAASAEQSLLELQRRLSPRTLNPGAFFAFREALAAAPSKGLVLIQSAAVDPEASALATQIGSALNAAGWTARSDSVFSAGGPPVGITLLIHTSMTADTSRGNALEKALKLTPLEVFVRNVPGESGGDVILIVGVKPPLK